MKVICVNNGNIKTSRNEMVSAPELVEGKTYTVEQCEFTLSAYHVLEMPFDPSDGYPVIYSKSRFIPCSTIDEMELLEQRQDQLQSL